MSNQFKEFEKTFHEFIEKEKKNPNKKEQKPIRVRQE